MAYVREPNPQPFLLGSITTHQDIPQSVDSSTQTSNLQPEPILQTPVVVPKAPPPPPLPNLNRPVRKRQKPIRYRDTVDISISSEESSLSEDVYYKVKKIIGQRKNGDSVEYLVQFAGEPAQNAMWIPFSDLNTKARNALLKSQPPMLH